ncbi:hypothetical protein C1645_123138 [Glomus cerebriforme]|uniref:Uncharacterized protein n=1 Tax=Glomus cerebriforme TaxID=658196 RepID=A0A397T533_9GLOM|nr:hypothetical protein C1645_123138 [Glomus cerebriforme]
MEKAATSNSNFNLYLLAAYEKIEDLIYPKYFDYLCKLLNGKLEIKYILYKPPTTWRDYSGLIDEALLYDWISERYSIPPPALPPRLTNYGSRSNFTSNLSSGIQNMNTYNYPNPNNYTNNNVINNPIQEVNENPYYNQQHNQHNVSNIPIPTNATAPIQIIQQYSRTSSPPYSSSSSPLNNISPQTNNQIELMNERHNYMNLFARDNSKQVKLVVCGSDNFNRNIKKYLEKLAFPIDEKALFIN